MENYKTVSKLLFNDEAAVDKTPSQKFDDLLRNQLQAMRNQRLRILNSDLTDQYYQNENYTEIANFIKKHVLSVGKEQAVKDFQCGLNFLHKDSCLLFTSIRYLCIMTLSRRFYFAHNHLR